MNKTLIHTLTIPMVLCLLVSDRLAEPAFSVALAPAWEMGVHPILPHQDALAGLPLLDLRQGYRPGGLTPGRQLWNRWWLDERSQFGLAVIVPELRQQIFSSLNSWVRGVLLAAQEGSLASSPVGPFQATSYPTLNAWLANFKPAAATRALKTYTGQINELSIFGVGADMEGHLAPETDFIRQAVASARRLQSRPRVLLTIANIRPRCSQDNWLIRHWLGSWDKINAHLGELLKISRTVDGLDIDYENMTRDDGPRYTEFVVKLGQEMHARGKFLTITVEHDTFVNGRIDWRRVVKNVDRVRIMAYQYHYDKTGPGAVSPPDVVCGLAKQALRKIPAQKLEIALPIYGFDWAQPGQGKLVGSMEDFRRLAAKPHAWVYRDERTQCARIDYYLSEMQNNQKHKVRHQVWFEDPASVAHKIALLQRLGVVHIGLWQLGAGDISELFRLVKFR